MRIKRLEITGFKSFCNCTVLQFDKPITAVVGPNGCGKSNIVDAIRWCMGEQSPKQLRGKAMEDVIFAGSDLRGPVGMCEVTLTFDNDGQAPVEYLSYSEIAVTRRLYRDGTSEYLLNKTPCRLRDVTDFFLGTGVGTRAYSIIEQGRVGMIVSSRPEDRRFLIEEAAGISKFKVKRKLAEKKMEATRHNLLRVSDVLQEIEKQLGSLGRQAEKAEAYRNCKDELRDLDLWSASHKWLGYCGELGVVDRLEVAAGQEHARLSQELSGRETNLETLKLALIEREMALDDLQRQLFERDSQLQVGRAQAARDREQAEELAARAKEATAERDGLAGELELLHAKRAASEAALAERQAEMDERSCRVEALEVAWQVHRQNLAAMETHLQTVRSQIGTLQNDIARTEAQAHSGHTRLAEYEERLNRLGEESQLLVAERRVVRSRAGEAERVLATTRQLTLNFAEERARFDRKKSLLDDQIAVLDVQLRSLGDEVQQLKSRKESLEEIQARLEDFAAGTRHVVSNPRPEWQLRGVVADFISVPRHLENTLELILSSRLRALVVPKISSAKDVVQLLVEERKGRAMLLPLDSLPASTPERAWNASPVTELMPLGDQVTATPGYEGLIEALFGNVWLVASLEEAFALRQAIGTALPAGALLVTAQGEVVEKTGFVTGGSGEESQSGILGRKREIRELEDLLQERTSEHAAIFGEKTRQDAERNDILRLLERLQQDKHQSEMQALGLENELKQSRDAEERLGQRLGALEQEQTEWTAKRDDLDQQTLAQSQRLTELQARLLASEDELSCEGQNRLVVLAASEAAQQVVTQAKIEFAQFQQEERSLRQESDQATQEHKEKVQRHGRLSEWIVEHAARSTVLIAKAGDTEEQCEVAAADKQRLVAALSEGRSAFDAEREKQAAEEVALRSLRQEVEKFSREQSQQALRLAQVKSAMLHLEESITERYRIALRDELVAYHLRPLWRTTQEKRVEELRAALDRIGAVNLQAPAEFRALSEREEFLSSQKSDLELALSQLDQAIQRINDTSRARFRGVFDLVNAKFQELFPRCFRGGQARLVLTQEDNLLESGIEIIAQPPGKKISSVEVLSGGEKAMTAVALIMSIFLIKPSPFCLLDEVDAPLDEANVIRFGDLLREMTERSQFIMITHNKRSMQIADALYGVTMQEPGVSTLVSVQFGHLEKRMRAKAAASTAGWASGQAVS